MTCKELLLVAGAMVLWFALNRWVLPWFGLPTCMSCGCGTTCSPSTVAQPNSDSEKTLDSTEIHKGGDR